MNYDSYYDDAYYYERQAVRYQALNRELTKERDAAKAELKALQAKIDRVNSLIKCSDILDDIFGDDRRKADPNYLPAVAISDLKYVLEK